MIGISSRTFDLQGARRFSARELDPKDYNQIFRWNRRMSRTATLDGGVSVYDTGYAPGDRTMNINVPHAPQDVIDFMSYMTKTYSEVVVSTRESIFIGNPADAYVDAAGAAVMMIQITQDLGG